MHAHRCDGEHFQGVLGIGNLNGRVGHGRAQNVVGDGLREWTAPPPGHRGTVANHPAVALSGSYSGSRVMPVLPSQDRFASRVTRIRRVHKRAATRKGEKVREPPG